MTDDELLTNTKFLLLLIQSEQLRFAAKQVDQYIRHCIETGNLVHVDAMPLLRMRHVLDEFEQPNLKG